jgi:GNAT superfamily N-acetyltransferase
MQVVGIATGVVIRRARAPEASGVAAVLRLAFAEYESLYTKQGYAATTPDRSTILRRMREGPLWVAVHDNRVVGTASAVLKETGAYVRGMAVVPAARGFGAGRLLLAEIETFAIGNGTGRMFLSTTPFLNRAIRLYKTFGFHSTREGPHELFGTPLFTMEKIVTQRTVFSIRQS